MLALALALLRSMFPLADLAPPIEPARAEAYGAVLACDEPIHDFGTLWAGPKLLHEFKVRNEGNETGWAQIHYSFSGTMAACIVAIESGETITVRWALDSRKLRNKFEKSLTLQLLPLQDDQTCGRCRKPYDDEVHLGWCGPRCVERVESPWCVRHSPDATCDGF